MSDKHKRNKNLAFNMLLIALGMLMLAYASVPLYRLFCQVTGFGGTPTVAVQAPAQATDQFINVRFNADTDPALPWEFKVGQVSQQVRIGEEVMTYYVATNLSDKPTTGHATYNVVPNKAAPYFAKIECFCFVNQTLAARQRVNMPISYYIDPAILDDPAMKGVDTITLSYTFFKQSDTAP